MTKPVPILLMTRPRAGSQRFLDQLDIGHPYQAIVSPLFEIEYAGQLPDMQAYGGVIFTSVHGVEAYRRSGAAVLPAYAVGDTTARAANQAGLPAISAAGNADDLVAMIRSRNDIRTPLLHVRGHHSRGDVAGRLTNAGVAADEVVLYTQSETPLNTAAQNALSGRIPVVAPVFSPRSAILLARIGCKAPLLVAALSQAVANSFGGLHITQMNVAERPESEAMLKLVAELLATARSED